MYDRIINHGLELNKMITSLQNVQVKKWKKLHKRKERFKSNLFLVEGFHIIEEAYKSEWNVKEIIIREGIVLPEIYRAFSVEVVSEEVFLYLAQTETPQGIIAIIEKKQDMSVKGNRVLLIDRIQDPGNLGAMIRTADAAGFSTIILGQGTVDMFNDKVIRATQGSLFHLDIIEGNLLSEISDLKTIGFEIWATALDNATIYNDVSLSEKIALVLGNEGAGVQLDILKAANHIVTIPIYGKAESLNVSVAAGILMYYVRG